MSKRLVQKKATVSSDTGNAADVKPMIDDEGEVNAVDRNSNSALHIAARKGNNRVVMALLNQTAEKDERTRAAMSRNSTENTADVSGEKKTQMMSTMLNCTTNLMRNMLNLMMKLYDC